MLPAKPNFSHFFGAHGPRGNFRDFFSTFWEVMGNPWKSRERKSTLPAKPSFSHFFWAYRPRGNSRDFFLGRFVK